MKDGSLQTDHLASVLSRVSRHLDGMAGQIFALEEAVGRSLQGSGDADNATITELQTLDYLRQSLEDLALLAHYLHLHSGELSERPLPVLHIVEKLRLDSTRKLVHGEIPAEFRAREGDIGELDLF